MTKHLAQELVAKYATALGYSFRGGRAFTTAQLHRVASAQGEHTTAGGSPARLLAK